MSLRLRRLLAVVVVLGCCSALGAEAGNKVTVSGWVIDSACAYTKGLDKPIGVACARCACAEERVAAGNPAR